MTGPFKAGNYRIVEGVEARTITFYKVYHHDQHGWVIWEVKDGDLNKIDKGNRESLTTQMWEQLQFWQ